MTQQINGYILIYLPSHPKANNDGYVYEHIVVAENKLGRPLRDGEIVHHIDGNRSNNSPDNLLVFKSRGDHVAFHNHHIFKMDGDTAYCPIRCQHYCKICGKPIARCNKAFCIDCFKAENRKRVPPRETLKELLKTKSFVAIGREYGVTDNAVRKWCISYNLPSKTSDIRNSQELDWVNI